MKKQRGFDLPDYNARAGTLSEIDTRSNPFAPPHIPKK